MILESNQYSSVSMGNELFVIYVIKTATCKVFDSFSRKFTFVKIELPSYKINFSSEYHAVSKANFILIIKENENQGKRRS